MWNAFCCPVLEFVAGFCELDYKISLPCKTYYKF